MTRFVDVPTLLELVNNVGIKKFISELSEIVHDDFLRWNEFEKSARTANHSHLGVIELMPISDAEQFSFKYVNGHPRNTEKGFSTIMAFGALASVETGFPLLLSELTATTAFRTAATSVVAAKALCRSDVSRMAMIGCGVQSEFQIIAFHTLLGINEVNIYDVDRLAMNKLEQNLLPYKDLKVNKKPSTSQAVKGVDIVTTATADKRWATIIEPGMLEKGMHLNAIGGDCPGKTELHEDVLKRGKIFVEYEPQSRVEGEIQQLPKDYPVTPLWEVLANIKPGRESDEQITIFDSVGFSLEDYSSLKYIYQLVQQKDLGQDISLVPDLDNPKDLYGLVMDARNVSLSKATG